MLKRLFGSTPDPVDTASMLRLATQQKDEGNIEEAVQTLRAAFRRIEHERVDYGISTFLRLPLYLQSFGRSDEAWGEFNRLLVEGYPNQPRAKDLKFMAHARVYDKMRLFLQREGKPAKAVRFGVLSYLAEMKGLHAQRRIAEVKEDTADECLQNVLKPLLKKAKLTDKLSGFLEVLRDEVEAPSKIDLNRAARRMDELSS